MSYLVSAILIVLLMMMAVALLVGATQLKAILDMLEAINNSIERVAIALKKR